MGGMHGVLSRETAVLCVRSFVRVSVFVRASGAILAGRPTERPIHDKVADCTD